MYGLSLISQALGHQVAGSDAFYSERCEDLKARGIPVVYTQDGKDLEAFSPDFVVYSAAVPVNNLDFQAAQRLNCTCLSRGEFLGYLSSLFSKSLNIGGTHGKSTTTSMLGSIFLDTKKEPTIHLGATHKRLNDLPVYLSSCTDYFINEACEYANMFQHLSSDVAAILNIDLDHMDYFKTEENLLMSFVKFSTQLKENGVLLFPFESAFKDKFLALRRKQGGKDQDLRFFSVAKTEQDYLELKDKVDFLAHHVKVEGMLISFEVSVCGKKLGKIELQVPGFHNVSNALVAFSVAYLEGLPFESIVASLKGFQSAEGRFTYKGEFQGAKIYVDYAHHPASTKVTIEAAKLQKPRHLWIVYQPLTYDRVARMFDDYIDALKDNELVLFYEIFSDRETDTQGMSSRLISDKLKEMGYHTQFCEKKEEIFETLKTCAGQGDIILFLGPEEVRNFSLDLIKKGIS